MEIPTLIEQKNKAIGFTSEFPKTSQPLHVQP